MGSSPLIVSSSLTTSNISRNDMLEFRSGVAYSLNPPALFASCWRQTLSLTFMRSAGESESESEGEGESEGGDEGEDGKQSDGKGEGGVIVKNGGAGVRGRRFLSLSLSLVIPLGHVHGFVDERFLVQLRRLAFALVLPGRRIGVLFVVAQALALRVDVLLAEVTAAGLVAIQGVEAEQLGEFEEVGHPAGALQRLVERVALAGDVDVLPEFGAQRGNLPHCLFQAGGVAGHAAAVPQDLAQPFVEVADRLPALDG